MLSLAEYLFVQSLASFAPHITATRAVQLDQLSPSLPALTALMAVGAWRLTILYQDKYIYEKVI